MFQFRHYQKKKILSLKTNTVVSFFYIHIYKVSIKKCKAIIKKKTLIIKLEDLHSHKMQVKKIKKMCSI